MPPKIEHQPILAIPNTKEKLEKLHKFLVENSIFTHYIYTHNLTSVPTLITEITEKRPTPQ